MPRLRGKEEIGLLEKYERHALGEVLFALTVGGLSQRKVVGWVRKFLGNTLSPTTIGAVLTQAQEEVQQRRQQRLRVGEYVALLGEGVYGRDRRRAERGARGTLASSVRTTNLAEGFFRHLRKYLGRFPGCVDPGHSEQVLGCYVLACEQVHA